MESIERFAEEVLHWRARRRPAWATQIGLRGHDHALRAPSVEAHVQEMAEIDALLGRAQRLPAGLDRDVLLSMLSTEQFELANVRGWARNPDIAVEFFDHVFHLLVATHIPDAERLAAIAARLEGMPAFFRDAWDRFDPADVPRLWVAGARQTLEGADAFLDAVRALAHAPGADRALASRIDAALAAAKHTLDAHDRWLLELHERARGEIAIGERALAELLARRHIADSPAALLVHGEALVRRFRAEVDESARTLVASTGHAAREDVVAQALEIVRADHPTSFAGVLHLYDGSIDAAREFVRQQGLATIPDVPLVVMETPAFLRHLVPFAAYNEPARFASPRRGIYFVTPKLDLAAFPRADVRNTTVHEAFPGHHLQLSVASGSVPLARYLSSAPDFAEGWALYCEALMGRHGFTAAPAERFMRARDALWRAVRIVLDVSLATGRLGSAQATERLMDETGMTRPEAEAEVLRYTQNPGYNLSYMWGRMEIEALRERVLAAGATERAFHDALLACGTIPLALAARETARVLGVAR